uniref:NADH-ubiquinone oxidoreductase chain 3 n=1 Tax=Chelodina pritchardi TaxID=904178 RepID=A0A343TEC2_9SAUR|nr:NADH dehydrogenase subunit 3 [Chelodina pritchardi]AUW55016.1 NADH dehydrogenase subunit 3 [Chelodina pritchardi]
MNMTTMIMLTLIVSAFLMLLNNWLAITKPNNEKLSPYECGFDPLESAWLPFSIRFFLVAILFLLFDLEIALLLPIPWATQLSSPILSMTWTLIILALLTLGLMYEWVQGGLEWAE